jgi:hypothetical protein
MDWSFRPPAPKNSTVTKVLAESHETPSTVQYWSFPFFPRGNSYRRPRPAMVQSLRRSVPSHSCEVVYEITEIRSPRTASPE